MPTQVTNYQCPACTGPLHFDADSGKLQCDYCGSAYDVAEIEAVYAEKEQKAEQAAEAGSQWNADEAGSPWSEQEAAGLRNYSPPVERKFFATRRLRPPRVPIVATRPLCPGSWEEI